MTLQIAFLAGRPVPAAVAPGFGALGTFGSVTLIGSLDTPCVSADRAMLIGWAFRRDDYQSYTTLAASDVAAIAGTEGEWALRSLWGHYLLFWLDDDGEAWIMRAPAAGPAIYHAFGRQDARAGRATCVFTDLSLARALGFGLDRPDAAALDHQIRFPLLRGHATGIEGATEILPGEIVRLSDGNRSAASWSPWRYLRLPPVRIDAEDLRTTVLNVVQAWSARFDHIQLELSGGLDSSVVAACLAGRERPWRGVNLATPGAPGDERPYARAMAEKAGVALEEIVMPDTAGNPLAPLATLRARPGGFGLLGDSDAALLAAARQFGADAIFTGVGGDNVFGLIRRPDPIVDALQFAGLSAAWRAAGDLAHMTRDSVWRAVYLAVRRWLIGPNSWPRDDSFLQARFAAVAPAHPWLAGAPTRHPGQFGYGRALLPIQPFIDGYDRAFALPMIAPLLSQPIVEMGLGVATWQWCEGGHDRALARAAFGKELAPAVRERRTKGRVESLIAPAFDANRLAIRDFLLGGWLAEAGIIDRAAIEKRLELPADARDAVYIRVLQIVDIERWVRKITDRST